MTPDPRRAAEEKMRRAGVPEAAIATFAHYHRQLAEGATGMLPDAELEPVGDLPELAGLPALDEAGRAALDQAVVIKLNGGLGTSMGMTRAKSLLEVKDGLTFLDITVRQVLALRRRHTVRLPLVLMNSFYTREDTLAALEHYPELPADVPADFVQSKEPKLGVDDLAPVSWPDDPALEWCPPGHGDVYTSLQTSGMLEALLEGGYAYAFLSNSDNLGAVLDTRILGWLAAEQAPFAMEVCERTASDRKGGHLARRAGDGGLVLRETAQTPASDRESLGDLSRWRFANTNNLWIDLRRLAETLEQRESVLGLPLIVNRKTVDPGDRGTPEVLQLETAMGAAIGVLPGARALVVPRTRFVPVKTTDDLLVLRSDAYALTGDARVELAAERRDGAPFVDLDDEFFKLLRDFEARFAAGPPSLVACRRLVVRGDVAFGRGVVARGDVEIDHHDGGQLRIADGAVLEG